MHPPPNGIQSSIAEESTHPNAHGVPMFDIEAFSCFRLPKSSLQQYFLCWRNAG